MNEDIELIKRAKEKDEEAFERLFSKYKPLASKISRRYFLIGQDEDDLEQEAMIGLFRAFQSFDVSKNSDFSSFASMCITRQIHTAIKSANREKNKALNERVELDNQGGIQVSVKDDEDDVMLFVIPSQNPLPDDQLISKQNVVQMTNEIIKNLSEYEKKVLALYLKGLKYKEMSVALKKDVKSIENTLTRIKNKLSFLKKL
ncbi:MAG: sigma-70 family RNA polymerase sigma factor [Christensenellales bacterium]